MPFWPQTLVARLVLWALILVAVSVPLFWLFFSVAVDRISVQVVDARILELANQVRGYHASAEASRARAESAPEGPRAPPPRLVVGGADADWVWQISVDGHVAERAELLEIADAVLPSAAAPATPDFQIADFDTGLGRMRIAGRTVAEVPPFSGDAANVQTVPVQYFAGITLARYDARVEELAARLRQLALLAAIPVSLALLGMLGFIILALRHQLGRLGTAMRRYEDADTDGIEGEFPAEIQRLVDRMNGMLRQNMRLVERTRNYVSKIAHDINHPLTVMKNALKGDAIDVELMNRQVDRMTGLVDRYSSLARAIGPDGQPARKTEMAPLLQDVVEGFAILYRRTPLQIDHSCPPDLLVAIPKHDLEAMLSNLVSNAHKFADRRVRVAAALQDGGLRLTVEDDGPGISRAERDAAFNWGKRLDEAPPGTGFGLSIVRDIAALYDGSVTLGDSAELGGLRVDIDLPLASD